VTRPSLFTLLVTRPSLSALLVTRPSLSPLLVTRPSLSALLVTRPSTVLRLVYIFPTLPLLLALFFALSFAKYSPHFPSLNILRIKFPPLFSAFSSAIRSPHFCSLFKFSALQVLLSSPTSTFLRYSRYSPAISSALFSALHVLRLLYIFSALSAARSVAIILRIFLRYSPHFPPLFSLFSCMHAQSKSKCINLSRILQVQVWPTY
jgi:hypothetical protein